MDGFFESINPVSGEVAGRYKKASKKDVEKAVEISRRAFKEWSSIDLLKRLKHLKCMRKSILNDMDEIVALLRSETGRPDAESLMSDILPTLELIKYYEDNAEKILGREKRHTPLFFRKNKSYVTYKPLGVVAVISPWNFPLQLSLAPVVTALAAGNSVILKPSEYSPVVGEIVGRMCSGSDAPDGVLQVLQGPGEVGKFLVEAAPDKVFFTGSVETGKKIMSACAKNLVELELELGGKDAMIVFSDADLERAVDAAVYGGFANAGQICVSVERLYLEDAIYGEFVSLLAERSKNIRVGVDGDYGPLIHPDQLNVISAHVDDALKKGASLLTDFKVEGRLMQPLILGGCNNSMRVMREETFGPVLAVASFRGEDEAVALANDSIYGLNASVFTRDLGRAWRVADSLMVGNCYVNDVIKNIGNPHLPFGGAKKSGLGVYHGPEGLRSFSQTTSVMVSENSGREPNWFPYSERLYGDLRRLMEILYGDKSFLGKIRGYLDLYRRFYK